MTNPDKSAPSSPPAPYFTRDIPLAEFAARRRRVADAIGPGAIAAIAGFGATGAFDIFRQANEFYYLCGVEVPHTYLTIRGDTAAATLYLPPRDEKHERSEGPQLNCDQPELVRRLTGVDEVHPHEALGQDIRTAAQLYTPLQPREGRQACRDELKRAAHHIADDPWDRRDPGEIHFRKQLEKAHPAAGEVRDLSPILDQLRVRKSSSEMALMRRAGHLSALAVNEAMRSTRPGVMEYELGAIGEYIYLVNGSRGAGYRPIIAAGANIWNAHYYRNNCRIADGDLVLMDCAPDVGCYTSDIGRIWPANGTYSPLQRELYGFIVEYHKIFLRLIRPGVTADQILAEAAAEMAPVIDRWPWSKPIYEAAARRTLVSPGHLSHGVGMAVHDIGNYRSEPLAPGVVFALDPQMWIPEEEIYIRVEDTVAVTETGVENLTADSPLELDDVEALMRESGMLQAWPPLS